MRGLVMGLLPSLILWAIIFAIGGLFFVNARDFEQGPNYATSSR